MSLLLPALLCVLLHGVALGNDESCNEESCIAEPLKDVVQPQRDHVLLQLPKTRASLSLKNVLGQASGFCCMSASDSNDVCGSCFPSAVAPSSSWCATSKEQCLSCGPTTTWCDSSPTAGASTTQATSPPPSIDTTTTTTTTTATTATTAATATTTTATTRPASAGPVVSNWITGTFTTGYWDCCKPSCAWPRSGNFNRPVFSCDAAGNKLKNLREVSTCDGGKAGSCKEYQPKAFSERLAMGFAAAAVSGYSGLNGNFNCSHCYELVFVDKGHPNEPWQPYGGANPKLVGRTMVIQVINIGYDVTGVHSFDIQIPAAGQGKFYTGCPLQYPGKSADDFDCGTRYGGCPDVTGCSSQPAELQPGCEWRYNWYYWNESLKKTNNPYVDFRRVRCPRYLTDTSGSIPKDDHLFPVFQHRDLL